MESLPFPPDFRDFLQLLNSNGVEYLLVGGYAVSLYGYPRSTGDIDVWVARSPANAERIELALLDFGFSKGSFDRSMFVEGKPVIRLGMPPLAIDILTRLSGLEFSSCYERKQYHNINGVDIPTLHVDDLRINKAATGRPKDQNDLDNLP